VCCNIQNRYSYSKKNDRYFDYSIKINDYYFNHNYKPSQIHYIKNEGYFILVVGDFVDANSPLSTLEEMTKKLSEYQKIDQLVEQTRYFAGRYLIFSGNNKGLRYVLTDPTVSIPINYTFDGKEYMLSSHAKYIADNYGYKPSEVAINIKNQAEQQQPLPYNMTMFGEIKTLIPNHFLNINDQKMVRFFPVRLLNKTSMDTAVNETIEKSKNIIKGYFNTRKISLPITSGVDSRALLSLMKDQADDLKMYTYYHDEFTEETGDIKIPKELSKKNGIDYHTLPIKEMPRALDHEITEELAGIENHRILNNGYTYSESMLSGYSPAQGDIISLAKSPFGKDLPESWATLNYFITKTHNYSTEIKGYVKSWMKDTEQYARDNQVSMYDLYNWEYRLGRWLPNNIKNYDYFIDPIYIFNCRYLTELWVSIPKNERTKRSLHLEIMKKEWPELLSIPLNPDDKVIDNLFANSYMFYFGSFAKYYLKKWL